MYAIGVNNFISRFQGGGARPNLYMVTLNFPGILGVATNIKHSYMCKATSLPEDTIGVTPVPFMGRQIKVAGDKEFADWNVTMLNDTDFDARRAFERWLNMINTHASNTGEATPTTYFSDLKVGALGRKGEILYTYNFRHVFPSSVGEVSLAYDNNNTVQEFTVTFAINYWMSDGTPDSE